MPRGPSREHGIAVLYLTDHEQKLGILAVDVFDHMQGVGNLYHCCCLQVLEDLYKAGKARAIGVSNYNETHIQGLMAAAEVKPMVNQVRSTRQLLCEGSGHLLLLLLCTRHVCVDLIVALCLEICALNVCECLKPATQPAQCNVQQSNSDITVLLMLPVLLSPTPMLTHHTD